MSKGTKLNWGMHRYLSVRCRRTPQKCIEFVVLLPNKVSNSDLFMHLFLSHYRAATPERQQELEAALRQNLKAPFLTRVTVFVEEGAPPLSLDSERVCCVPSKRMTYQQIFAWINAQTGPNDINILLNSDIGLVSGFEVLQNELESHTFLALSRQELAGVYDAHPAVSQDVWIWRGVCKIEGAHFYMGVRGCDNRLAAEAYLAGYTLINPCRNLLTHHHHRSSERAQSYNVEYVNPPYLAVSACFWGQESELQRMVGGEEWVRQFRQQRAHGAHKALLQDIKARFSL